MRSVITEQGEIACDAVILAGGAWSRTFLENIGLGLPQLTVRSSALCTSSVPEITPGDVEAAGASFRRRDDGGYTIARSGAARFDLTPAAFAHLPRFARLAVSQSRILKIRLGRDFFGPLGRRRWRADEVSPFECWRVLDPAPDERLLESVMESARVLYPQFAGARPVESWAGLIDVMPDETPVIDMTPGMPGLVIATGFSGHGFGLGPGGGLLAAQLAIGESPSSIRRPSG